MAFDILKIKFPHIKDQNKWSTHSVPFIKNYFEVIKSRVHDIKTSHFWVIASFSDFDNTLLDYIPEQFEKEQIHVFYSGQNKEGNILLIPKQKFLEQMNSMNFLRDFRDINYHSTQISNNTLKTIYFNLNNLVEDYNQGKDLPYVWMVNKDLKDKIKLPDFYPSFWEDQKIYTWGETNDVMLVPFMTVTKQLYENAFISNMSLDYPVTISSDRVIQISKT